MNIFLNLWTTWSNTEKISTSILFVSLLIVLPLLVFFITKDKKIFLFSLASLIASAFLTVISLLSLNLIFGINISYIFMLLPFIVLFVNILNIGTCIGYFMQHHNSKEFNYIMLKKEYIRDSIQLSILICLMFSAISIFLISTFLIFIILTALISLAVIWLNYTLLYWIVK